MIVDHRTYTVRPGKINDQMELYKTYGFEIQKKYLGQPLALFVTETGDLNTYIHLWAYKSAADREEKRAALNNDSTWADYIRRSSEAEYIVKQETKLLVPAAFVPLEFKST